jgi:hypothetical protein
MKYIFSKVDRRLLLHIIHRADDNIDGGRMDLTQDKEFLQCAVIRAEADKVYKAHKHITKPQFSPTIHVQEAFIIIKGMVYITIYDIDDSIIETIKLSVGDLAVLLAGGHAIQAGSDGFSMYEIKTGQYEGQSLDKIFI